MRLKTLEIENFRGFESLTLEFHPEVTVLVGANGSGKTSVLEAVVSVLANLFKPQSELEDPALVSQISGSSCRRGTDHAFIKSTLELESQHTELEVGLEPIFEEESVGQRRRWTRTYNLGTLAGYYERSRSSNAVPIACYYNVNRHAHDSTPRSRDAVFRTPIDAWKDAWNSEASFDEFFQWFREREDLENADRVEDRSLVDHQLDAARRAIMALLPGYDRPRIQRSRTGGPGALWYPVLTVTKNDVQLAFEQLSEGERTLVSLAGDIARRLAIANPESNDPLTGEGIVLIDEVDLHLHPEWQAKVIPALRRTFPNIQFVVTTHSLVVLSYVPSECVRLLKDFEAYDAPVPTEGREPNALAIELFGIPLRPPAIDAKLNQVAELIDDEHFDQARAELESLSQTLGDTDTGIVRLQTAIALEDV